MISPKQLSIYRYSFAAIVAFFMLVGTAWPASAVAACRMPSPSIFTMPGHGTFPGLRFSSLSSGVSAAAGPGESTISFSDPIYSVSETGVTATILVKRTGDLTGSVTVDYSTADGTAVAGEDYEAVSGTIFWADGDATVQSFTVPIIDDTIAEGGESVNIILSNPTGGAVIIEPGEAVLMIADNELFSLSINDVTQAEGNGPNTMTFAVTLSGAADQPVTVNYSTANGSATAPSDFTAVTGELLTFSPGETTRFITITINGDTVAEADESFSVNLFNASNAMIADGSATGLLLNDDAGPTPTPTPSVTPTPGVTPTPSPTPTGSDLVQFSSTSYSVNENVGSAIITVTRTGPGAAAASVNYATSNGTATAGQDYTAVSGTLTWAAGDLTAKTFTIPINDDLVIEAGETVNLTLSGPVGVALGPPSSAVLTILDNDSIPQVSVNDVAQAEGNDLNPMVFTVTLSNASGQPVTVNYATANGTATGGADYVSVSGGVLTFNPGETSKQVTISILGDFTVEPNEDFLLNLTGASNATITDSQGVGTLNNDDSPGTVQFTASNFVVNEGNGTATITITRTGGISQGVSVRFVTVDGSAVNGEDYSAIRTVVTFEPGETEKTVTIPIINDSTDEPDETINIALENPTGGAILGSPINAIVTILDNDAPPMISVNNVTLNEGNSGTTAFTFTVSMAGSSSQAVTVNYATADGTATAPSDYTALPQGTLTFEPGENVMQVTVLVNGDFTTEPNETFSLNLSSPLGATIGAGQGIGTIVNDDVGGAFKFTSAEYVVNEGNGFITITVQRTGGLAAGATVDYSTANGTATAGQDYTAVSGTLTFTGGQTTQSFNIPITNDSQIEVTENFAVILSNATGSGSTLGVPNTATVYISDPNGAPEGGTLFDYDGDGRADISVRRPSNNIWYIIRSAAGFTAQEFGVSGDQMAPADYDGDERTDVAVFRPSDGRWYIHMSASQTFQIFNWGANGDLAVPSDRDGDGRTDLVVYRPSNNTWYTRLSGSNSISTTVFGVAGDKPVIGDFDGDGRFDIAVFRPSNNNWYILKSGIGFSIHTWGAAGDIPTPADYDGDGTTDLAVFRPSTGQWLRHRSLSGIDSVNWGQAGDIPVPADYDGDGKADVAVFRPSNSTWYIVGSSTGFRIQQFGEPGDVPTPSAFIR